MEDSSRPLSRRLSGLRRRISCRERSVGFVVESRGGGGGGGGAEWLASLALTGEERLR